MSKVGGVLKSYKGEGGGASREGGGEGFKSLAHYFVVLIKKILWQLFGKSVKWRNPKEKSSFISEVMENLSFPNRIYAIEFMCIMTFIHTLFFFKLHIYDFWTCQFILGTMIMT